MNRLRALAAAPFVLALAAHLLLLVLWYDRLPDPLATHFSAGAGGKADGFTSLAGYAAVSSGLLVALGAAWTLLVRRGALWGTWATAGFAGGLLDLLLRDNLDAADPAEVTAPLATLTVAAGIAAMAALAGRALTRLVPVDPAAQDGPDGPSRVRRLELGAHEVAGWSRDTGSRGAAALSSAFLLAGAAAPVPAVLFTPWPYALIALVGLAVGLPGLALSRVRVAVDRRGLTVTPALFPRPRIRIPLDEITSATVQDVDALAEFGGWGYRTRPHRSALLLRSGEALSVRRANGFEFLVTVPDAETAAALLDALAARAREGAGPGGRGAPEVPGTPGTPGASDVPGASGADGVRI
ncbi:hypothetical protein ACFY8W_18400 [Streptomyces sp. NPDC012637]|uniref:hypothetical protein n=1 Tax=Streptomyces sp. NPDC012637 TaxID=3364842 RepID=UPI0036E7B957